MKTFRKLWCLTALLATAMFFLAGFDSTTVSATNTPQPLPFSQNWGNTALITANKTALQAPLHNPAITLKKTAFREYFRKNAMIFISVNPPFLEIRQVS